METTIDPFDPAAALPADDPVSVERFGIAVLDKLEESENLRADYPEGGFPYEDKVESLKANLTRYKEYKAARGEEMFDNASNIERKRTYDEEKTLANKMVSFTKGNQPTFERWVRNRGDDRYIDGGYFDTPGMKEHYTKRVAIEMFGFSPEEISSGIAEPQVREMVGARGDQPTLEAIEKWALDRRNFYSRWENVNKAASQAAQRAFLRFNDSEKDYEKAISDMFPEISPEERARTRAVRNLTNARLEKEMGHLRPMVSKVFNTVAEDTGITSRMGEEKFGSVNEAIEAFSKLPDDDFPNVVLLLGTAAEAHGQTMDGYFNRLGATFTRAWGELLGGAVANMGEGAVSRVETRLNRLPMVTRKGKTPEETARLWLAESLAQQVDDLDIMGGGKAARLSTMLVSERLSPEEIQAARKLIDQTKSAFRIQRHLRDWKGSVAKAQKGSAWNPLNWGNVIVGSIPEMAMAASGPPGWLMIQQAQTQRNLVDFEKENPGVDSEKIRGAANVAATFYAGLSKLQVDTLFKKIPGIKSGLGQFGSKLFLETAQESAQDVSSAVTLKFYGMIDESIPEVKLIGTGGAITDMIERSPETAFNMLPLVLIGMGGRKVADKYLDRKSLNTVLRDRERLSTIFTPEEVEAAQKMPLDELIQKIEAADMTKAAPVETSPTQLPDSKIDISYDSETETYNVSNGEQTVEAKSPEEAAEAARQLDPEGFDAAEKALKDRTPVDRSTPTVDLDPDEQVNYSPLGPVALFAQAAKEDATRVGERLPPKPDPSGEKAPLLARWRYGLQTFLSGGKRAGKTVNRLLRQSRELAEGISSQFNDIASRLQKFERKHLKAMSPELRETESAAFTANAYKALRGDADALAALPSEARVLIGEAREAIDTYSQKLINQGVLSPTLAKAVGGNIGTYVTRTFKAFNPDEKWTYATVKKNFPEVFEAARAEIDATIRARYDEVVDGNEVTEEEIALAAEEGTKMITESDLRQEVDDVMRGMLYSDNAREFYAGTRKVGKVSVTNFFKRKDLSPALLDYLGEVVNPVQNIATTGAVLSKKYAAYSAQMRIADFLISSGLATRKRNLEQGLGTRVAQSTVQIEVETPDGETKTINKPVTKKGFEGLGELYTDPALAEVLEAALDPGSAEMDSVNMLLKGIRALSGTSKFMQVILSPDAYPVNLLGGGVTELFNGRVRLDGWGRRAYFNRFAAPDKAYTPAEQSDFNRTSLGEYKKNGGLEQMTRTQMRLELEQRGLRGVQVFAEDFADTFKGANEQVKGAARALGVLYSAPDNQIKQAAMANEMLKWMEALPDDTPMGEVMDRAAADVRATTQNYNLVPEVLRNMSRNAFFVGTYISFFSELLRTMAGTAKLAATELTSGNPALVKAGTKRLTGMVATASMVVAARSGLLVGGIPPEDREYMAQFLPPWMRDTLAFLPAPDGELAAVDVSYLIPQAPVLEALRSVITGVASGKPVEAIVEGMQRTWKASGELNVAMQTGFELAANKKVNGGPIWSVNDSFSERQWKKIKHLGDSMFRSGLQRKVEDGIAFMSSEPQGGYKTIGGEITAGYKGSFNAPEDFFLRLLGLRITRIDTTDDKFVEDNLKQPYYAVRDSKMATAREKKKFFKGLEDAGVAPAEWEQRWETQRENAKGGRTVEEQVQDFRKIVRGLQIVGVSTERILAAAAATKVPREFRAALHEEITK